MSQETSAVWVGRVCEDSPDFDDLWEDDGHIFIFPRDSDERIIYCNLEGITWLDKGIFAVVSDKANTIRRHGIRCADYIDVGIIIDLTLNWQADLS